MISNSINSQIKFSTKAETLKQFMKPGSLYNIPPVYTLSHDNWHVSPDKVLSEVAEVFKENPLAVRSSATSEDGLNQSNAGAFESVLNVNPNKRDDLQQAIEKVFSSYPVCHASDQVLIQQMVENIAVSGVILTRFVDDGSPYYILNYDDQTGRTDSITSGTGVHKTVMVYRNYKPEYCDSHRVRNMLALAKEVEKHCGLIPLDIEFAIDHDDQLYLLQVRRISTVGGWHPDIEHRVDRIIPQLELYVDQLSARKKGLYGDYTVLGNMPDWNPAELIGLIPSPLAASLFRKLITSYNWSLARTKMGYRDLPHTELMVLLSARPYIDVRASFNSFLPSGIADEVGEKLINAWLDRLSANPSLHDKVEFEVVQTVYDFSFEETHKQLYPDLLRSTEKDNYFQQLLQFTRQALNIGAKGSLPLALKTIDQLAEEQASGLLNYQTDSPPALSAYISLLLNSCIEKGTIPFNTIARHAFIAESILRSAIKRGALKPERVAEFKSSFKTIMGELAADTIAVNQGSLNEEEFQNRYGHLRPGTYDIMSPCYRDRQNLFTNCSLEEASKALTPFRLDLKEERDLKLLLGEIKLDHIEPETLLEYARMAIKGREYAKFIFTRNLSEALEAIATWGAFFNMGREELSFLRIEDIIDNSYISSRTEMTSQLMWKVDHARIEHSFASIIKLSYLIRGVRDIHIVPIHRSEPNFITTKRIERPFKQLEAAAVNCGNLKDHIICIDNADPGFDWIFTKGIAGLITKYGGANSHMAIRCAELSLPAAIGCGEDLFERIKGCQRIELDCSSKSIRPTKVN